MAQLTLTDIFPNATENATTITLTKADLGLTEATTTADRFVAGVVIKAKPIMTRTQYDSDIEQNVYISDGFNSFETRNDDTNDINYQIHQFNVNLSKTDQATLNPEDY